MGRGGAGVNFTQRRTVAYMAALVLRTAAALGCAARQNLRLACNRCTTQLLSRRVIDRPWLSSPCGFFGEQDSQRTHSGQFSCTAGWHGLPHRVPRQISVMLSPRKSSCVPFCRGTARAAWNDRYDGAGARAAAPALALQRWRRRRCPTFASSTHMRHACPAAASALCHTARHLYKPTLDKPLACGTPACISASCASAASLQPGIHSSSCPGGSPPAA